MVIHGIIDYKDLGGIKMFRVAYGFRLDEADEIRFHEENGKLLNVYIFNKANVAIGEFISSEVSYRKYSGSEEIEAVRKLTESYNLRKFTAKETENWFKD